MRRTSEQKCRELAKQHGWGKPCNEGDVISIALPAGKVHSIDETHSIIVPYGTDLGEGEARNAREAYAAISREIEAELIDPCDCEDCRRESK